MYHNNKLVILNRIFASIFLLLTLLLLLVSLFDKELNENIVQCFIYIYLTNIILLIINIIASTTIYLYKMDINNIKNKFLKFLKLFILFTLISILLNILTYGDKNIINIILISFGLSFGISFFDVIYKVF